jgi:hypothetical protein
MRSLKRMNAATWYFMRHAPGDLRPIARALVEDFCSGRRPIVPDVDGMVRQAEVVVRLHRRQANAVLRLGFFQYRAGADGLIDSVHLDLVMSAITEATFPSLVYRRGAGVIHAEQLFARRRLEHLSRWTPTTMEMAKLSDMINQKAGLRIA